MNLSSLFPFNRSQIRRALLEGATIVDVRGSHAFDNGKIRDSFNMPLERLDINVERLRNMRRPIIVCGNSGSEASSAIQFLESKGIKGLLNGGDWKSLYASIKKI